MMENSFHYDTAILSHLRPIGTRAQCTKWHKGTIAGYYVNDTHLFAILNLDQHYWTENKKTCITQLVVHASNLEEYENEL